MVYATKVELTNSTGNPRRLACASGTAITKGTILTLSDARTAAAVSDTFVSTGYICAGIASMDKDSTDTSTSISAWTDGIFEITASGSITVGQPVKSCGQGYVMAAVAADVASGVICGYALETASDDEVINVRLSI